MTHICIISLFYCWCWCLSDFYRPNVYVDVDALDALVASNKNHRLLKRTRNFTLEWCNYGFWLPSAWTQNLYWKGSSRVTLYSISSSYHYGWIIWIITVKFSKLYKLHVKTKWNRPGSKSFLEAVIFLWLSIGHYKSPSLYHPGRNECKVGQNNLPLQLFIYFWLVFVICSIAQLKHHEHEPSGILSSKSYWLTFCKLHRLIKKYSTTVKAGLLQRKNNTTDLTYALHSLSHHSFTILANVSIFNVDPCFVLCVLFCLFVCLFFVFGK